MGLGQYNNPYCFAKGLSFTVLIGIASTFSDPHFLNLEVLGSKTQGIWLQCNWQQGVGSSSRL